MSLPSPRYYKYLPKLFSFFLIIFSFLNPVVAVFADQDTASTTPPATYYRPIIVEFRNAKQLSEKELYLQYILSIPLSATTSAEFLVDQVTYAPTSTPKNQVNYIDLDVPENALDSFVNAFNRGSEENATNLSNSSTTVTNNEEGVSLSGSSTTEEVSNGSFRVQSDTEISTSSETVLGVGFASPNATSTATSSLYTLSTATTSPYTVYTPFGGSYSDDSRGTVTTYLTLNGQLVATYSYDKSNPSGGKVGYVLTNYLGTPVLETNEVGDIVQMDITDVFGNYVQRDQRNDNELHTKSYTGHEFDDVTGNIYAKARYLATPMHSFLSVDPLNYNLPQGYLFDPQQLNTYSYARNNPITYTDPTGGYIESALDVGFIAYDLNSLKNNLGQGNYYDAGIDTLALAADGIGLATPFGTGFGLGVRYAGHGGDANKAFGGAKQMVAQAGPVIDQLKNNTLVKNAAGELSNVFRGGSVEFKASDFKKTLVDGIINPALKSTPEGMSVNTMANVAKANSRSEVAIPILSLPKGLSLKQAGQNLNHYVIAPTYKMTVTKFENLLDKMTDRIKKLNK